ncbi:chalcone isomerase family protein [Pseudoalteromonas sp. PS5]|uniref:chalcone isomerase family protein n=1 Tax=Pseudoalteromonas sp. PS5 TaxID=1437473 RepID=UPI000FFED622|nr:chalcone isomerase family protein [Pseudoalteromonas sp. PS5]RXE96726.1 hypothetical protein D9603_18660 [Pseudoalteromonas sp. PS5]
MRRTILFTLLLLLSKLATASENVIANFIENPKQVGQTSRMTYLFWDVYDASLFATQGNFSATQPFALKLQYLRSLNGEDIAKRSLEEMQKQGFNDAELGDQWLTIMNNIFPDVKDETVLLGIKTAQDHTLFYHNDELIGEVKDPAFTTWFFNIWLGEKTTEPQMRNELLGLRR